MRQFLFPRSPSAGLASVLFAILPAALALVAIGTARASAQEPLKMTLVASQLAQPVHVAHRAGDYQSLFVAEIRGWIRIRRGGVMLSSPYLDISAKVGEGFEQGLLGFAFHPDYPAVKRVFVAYTTPQLATVVESYDEDPLDPDRALPGSGQVVLGPVVQPGIDHNGGCLAFGPDGMLYIGMGDGGSPNDSGPGHGAGGNAQSLGSLLGKILRLDVDLPHPHIPASNPFVSTPGARGEVWAYGLRNPWRFSFDAETGELFIGDVGEVSREEISVLPPGAGGANLGWRCFEGSLCTGLSGCGCDDPTLVAPVYEYDHSVGCSITGGVVYRGCAIPSLAGKYVFADYCAALTWTFDWDGVQATNVIDRTVEFGVEGRRFASFGQDALGEVYAVEYQRGELWRLEPAVPQADCDADGISDACALAAGLATDSNGDGVPDDCSGTACQLLPTVYCTSSDSLDCASHLQTIGSPSVSSAGPFFIIASGVISQRPGVLYYGEHQAAVPFHGGTLCVGSPATRTKLLFTHGQLAPTCTGALDYDFNALIRSGTNPYLVAGKRIHAQYLYRDTDGGFGLALTLALKFDICP